MCTNEQESAWQEGVLTATLWGGWWKNFGVLCLIWAVAVIVAPAQTLTTLHAFTGAPDGVAPDAGVIQGTDGNYYGTTVAGGIFQGCTMPPDEGCGTVFKMTPSGTVTVLHNFCAVDGSRCPDGFFPRGPLMQATDGNFYGITENGGVHRAGTLFEITPSGALTTIYAFCSQSQCADGGYDGFEGPGLVQGPDGNFYGTAPEGGANLDFGTVYKITPSGTLTVLYSFCSGGYGCPDGYTPDSGLTLGSDGNFYGTTTNGGNLPPANGGTVFKITPNGAFTTLYKFCSQGGQACTDGESPNAPLARGTDGTFYGTTLDGGAHGGGTIFKITPTGALTTLYSFCAQSGCADGYSPFGSLFQASDGNFYGTATFGGIETGFPVCSHENGCGTLFEITPSGTFTLVYQFCSQSGCTDGAQPGYVALISGGDGNLYGTTFYGGLGSACVDEFGGAGCGTVFKLSLQSPGVGLSPSSLSFGPQPVQAPNVPQVVTLTNTGQAPLSITSIAITGQNSGDFQQSNNCPISPNMLGAGDNCSITVVFAPQEPGTLNADVTITDNAPGSPQNVPLAGTGVSGKPRPARLQYQ
jgi:uncharacterized repeat protein (TIGR03803 family)